jgi:hypothetical protein
MATDPVNHVEPRKAIIPIAGLGTRMFPLSGIVPKAFMPILEAPPADSEPPSSSALVRPFLHSLLRYVLDPSTGIEQVCVVISEDQVGDVLSTMSLLDERCLWWCILSIIGTQGDDLVKRMCGQYAMRSRCDELVALK